MLAPAWAKWHQTPAGLFQLALQAPHPRTRERFVLYLLATTDPRTPSERQRDQREAL